MSLLSANVIICETVLTEKTEVISAVRIMNVLRISGGLNFAKFSSVTFLASEPGDTSPHKIKVQMISSSGDFVAEAPERWFFYGYNVDPSGPGGYTLTTEFNLDLSPLGTLGSYAVWVFLDDVRVCGAPLIMRRV